ncbi:response regulator [Vibrio sinensis]|uniref:histidine kinase n=1 Tax=Vibrio sinensis TaxID=2302434 RepID=A0A3A6QFK7_9VIBR|nr:ATP-binding protein [Vibrio sinensis]RJX71410.1 response regulator [Vibrio sinensis]
MIQRSIKLQIMIASGIIFSLVATFTLTHFHYKDMEMELHNLQNAISDSKVNLLKIRRHEKDFMSRVDPKYVENLHADIAALKSKVHNIQAYFNEYDFNNNYSTSELNKDINAYQATFDQLAQQKIFIEGTNKTGLIEKLKNSWFNLSKRSIESGSTEVMKELLTLQESMYYFLRTFSSESLQNVHNGIFKVSTKIPSGHEEVQSALEEYRNIFLDLQNAYQILGYTHHTGLHGELRRNIHSFERSLNILHNEVPQIINSKLESIDHDSHLSLGILAIALAITLGFSTWSITRLERRMKRSESLATTSNKAKSAFLANMSHEIRTPLNGIIGMAQIIADTRLTPNQREYLHAIDTSSQTLLMLINDILDLSKIESGHLEITPYPSHVRDAIFDTASMISGKVKEQDLSLYIDIDAQLPHEVKMDEHRLRQILMNLVSNAVKFTQSGSVTLQVKAKLDQGQAWLTFSVIDTGIGIDKAKQDSIFEPFQQEDASITRQFGGTGLGLSISSQLVSMMGGELKLNSVKDQGSEFYFTLPTEIIKQVPSKTHIAEHISIIGEENLITLSLKQNLAFYGVNTITILQDLHHLVQSNIVFLLHDEHSNTHQILEQLHHLAGTTPVIIIQDFATLDIDFKDQVDGFIKFPILGSRLITCMEQSKEAMHERRLHDGKSADDKQAIQIEIIKERVLIVEDNRVNQQVVSLFLKKGNYEYDIANNGLEALTKIQQGAKYQLMLMDCMMPEMDGFTATKEIRKYERDNSLPATPIVALTASVLDQDIKKCFDVGMDDYLAKPLKKEKLYEMVKKYY